MSSLPDRIKVNGRWYVAEDAVEREPERLDRYVSVKALCAEYDIDPHKAYDAIRDGSLEAVIPSGQVRGRRCLRSEFRRWYEEKVMCRC